MTPTWKKTGMRDLAGQTELLLDLEPVVAGEPDRHLKVAKDRFPHAYLPSSEGRTWACGHGLAQGRQAAAAVGDGTQGAGRGLRVPLARPDEGPVSSTATSADQEAHPVPTRNRAA